MLSPKDWPGVHCAEALAEDKPIRGIWVDRTKLFAARRKDPKVPESKFTSEETLHLAPLSCLAHLTSKQRCAEISAIIEGIEKETVERHQREGTTPLGAEAVCRRQPNERPKNLRKSPQPYFHASKAAFRVLMDGFRDFVAAYRTAAERLAAGDRSAAFPENCYPPGLPFVGPA